MKIEHALIFLYIKIVFKSCEQNKFLNKALNMAENKIKKHTKSFINQCVNAIRKIAVGLNIEVFPAAGKGDYALAVFRIMIGDEVRDFVVRTMPPGKLRTAEPVGPDGDRYIFIFDSVEMQIGMNLQKRGIAFADLAGNIHLPFLRSLIYVAGLPDRGSAVTFQMPTTADGTLNAKVVFALLARPEFLRITQRELAQKASVSLGGISAALAQLQARGFITRARSKQPRILLRKEQLLDEWRHEYRSRLAPKLDEQARRMAGDTEALQSADVVTFGMQWGGEVAAQRLTNYLRPVTYTLYANPAIQGLPRLAALAKLRKADDGNIKIVSRFWNFDPADDERGDTVPLPLVYAELMASDDPRCQESAQLIREKILAD